MILYLSGPISSDLDEYKDKFAAAESYLTAWKGHTALNPSMLPFGLEYDSYMWIDYAMIAAADGIVMLRGWKHSEGAKKELLHAVKTGKKVFYGIESVPIEKGMRECNIGL